MDLESRVLEIFEKALKDYEQKQEVLKKEDLKEIANLLLPDIHKIVAQEVKKHIFMLIKELHQQVIIDELKIANITQPPFNNEEVNKVVTIMTPFLVKEDEPKK